MDLLKSDFLTVCFLTFFNFNLPNVNSLECVSMKNQECQIRPEIVNLNTNEPLLYPYSIKINKCKAVVIQSMIHILKYVFLTTLKAQMSKYLT